MSLLERDQILWLARGTALGAAVKALGRWLKWPREAVKHLPILHRHLPH